MRDYLLYLEQAAEGCDYTIGCGVQIEKLQARTEAEALAEARQLILGDEGETSCGYHDDTRLRTAVLYEVAHATVCPLPQWYREYAEGRDRATDRAKEADERQQHERLKAKYG